MRSDRLLNSCFLGSLIDHLLESILWIGHCRIHCLNRFWEDRVWITYLLSFWWLVFQHEMAHKLHWLLGLFELSSHFRSELLLMHLSCTHVSVVTLIIMNRFAISEIIRHITACLRSCCDRTLTQSHDHRLRLFLIGKRCSFYLLTRHFLLRGCR